MIRIKTGLILEETIPEVRMFVEYWLAKKYLEQTIDDTIKKHSLPDLNYKSSWNLEIETRKTDKKLRSW